MSNEVKLAAEIEASGKDKYGTPAEDVRKYVARAIAELDVDNTFVNDTDSTMYAWRLSHQPENVIVAQEVLKMSGASLSQLARAMADADEQTRQRIERDERYYIDPPQEM